MAYVSGSSTHSISFSDRLREIKTQIADALAARRVYRSTLTELSGLSDRDLADLGMSRSSIKSVALEAAFGASEAAKRR